MSTNVYRLAFNPNRYQYLAYDFRDPPLELYFFRGESRSESWVSLPVYVHHPRLEQPDIWELAGTSLLVMTAGVVQLLEPFVSMAGELLPLRFTGNEESLRGQELLALNILQDVDCLDTANSDLSSTEISLSFIEHRLPGTGLFKVPQLDATEIFYAERDDDSDGLASRIAKHGLRGPELELVWSSATGSVPVKLLRF